MPILQPFLTHNHTDASNFRLLDCINKVEDLLDYALKLGLSGICITDHETIAAHVKAKRYIEENEEIFKDFKLGYGDEIYLVDKEEMDAKVDAYDRVKFYHFIILAKNEHGYEGLKKITSKAWEHSFMYKGIERVPSYKDELAEIMKEYKGDIIAQSACIGGELPQKILSFANDPTEENRAAMYGFIQWMIDVFGKEDIYFELQPAYKLNPDDETEQFHNDKIQQHIVNTALLQLCDKFGVKPIITTDAHYLNKQQQRVHHIYLQSADGDREVDSFYATTYLMGYKELSTFFDKEVLSRLTKNTWEIRDKLQDIDFHMGMQVPNPTIPEFEQTKVFDAYLDQYEYINKYYHSEYEVDRYYLKLLGDGMIHRNQEFNEQNLGRINIELRELWAVSDNLKQRMSSYFVEVVDIVDLMWKLSIVGVSRGSAACYYTNYLLGIVQINAIDYDLPYWRFLSKERPTLPDIDLDTESDKRLDIVEAVKEKFGYENVLNISTVTTEGSASAVLTACRGLGIDPDTSHNIANLIPHEKVGLWTIKECLYGDEKQGKNPVQAFIKEIDKYPDLRSTIEAIEGLIRGRSQHASGLVIFPNGYLVQNAMMKTTKGLTVTQFDMDDTKYMGGLKYDFLSIKALDRIRETMKLLTKFQKIQWQGSLRSTFDYYFHPDVLEMKDPKMFKMLFNGDVIDAFQFETNVGSQAIRKIAAHDFDEICAANSLMRLSVEGAEQPIDRYVRFRKDIQAWYLEMQDEGLSKEEQKVLYDLLYKRYGICDTQEYIMMVAMDKHVTGFTLKEANKLRKSIANKDKKKIDAQYKLFMDHGERLGTSRAMLDYVWNVEFKPSFGYAFSLPHIAGYSLILFIEMNICLHYGSIFWKTACLTVNSGLSGDNTDKTTDYSKLSKATGRMKDSILPPSINHSDLGFLPLPEKNKIIFGLKPIVGLGSELARDIIDNRPYDSFSDFYWKMYENGNVTNNVMVALIKAGCFDEFNVPRRKVMFDFVNQSVKSKDKLTLANVPKVRDKIPVPNFKWELNLIDFKNKIIGRNKIPMNEELTHEFVNQYKDRTYGKKEDKRIKYSFDDNGFVKIDEKTFKSFFNEKVSRLKLWLSSKEAADIFNRQNKESFWKKHCMGNVESWEMEALAFYHDKHELDLMPIDKYIDLVQFSTLPEKPDVEKFRTGRGGHKYPLFKTYTIAGTVVDKDKKKHLVYALTQDGVVTVRYSKGQFIYYNNKDVSYIDKVKYVNPSWFERGTKLIFVGYRRNDEFILNNKNSNYEHSTMKINAYNSEQIQIISNKVEQGWN